MKETKEMRVWSLCQEDLDGMATHSSILAWRIPWTEEPGGLHSTGLQGVGHDWETSLSLEWSSGFLHFLLFHSEFGKKEFMIWATVSSWSCFCSLQTKLVEVMEFQLSYFKSWKVMLWKCCTQYASNWKTQQWPQDWKRSVFIPIPKKGNAKQCSNYCTIALTSHARKVMFKIVQARLQQHMNCEHLERCSCWF